MRRLAKTGQSSQRAQASIIIAFLVATVLNGCGLLASKTTALEKIHESYRIDFQQSLQQSLPSPSDRPQQPDPKPDQAAFAETLREIRDYRVRYGENSKEASHLQVLEGMIYLQSGQFGMAHLVAHDVATAGTNLKSGTGAYTRDQLLAMTFSDLITGWEEIAKFHNNTPGSQGGDVGKLIAAADSIKAQLDSLDKSKLAQPEVDEGAIYIATNAAIYYVWVYAQCSFQGQSPTPPCSPPNTKQQWFDKGRALIGRYLSALELKAATDATASNVPAGRLRYLSWYGFLARQATTP
jgi:hypothetical protein